MQAKKKILVAGLGEVGSAVYQVARESGRFEVYGYDIDPSKTVNQLGEVPVPIDFLHVAVPYSQRFMDIVSSYVEKLKPRAVFIHSTVAPGTTRRVYEKLGIPTVYTPVRGKHPNLKQHLYFWPKWVASLPESFAEEAGRHLEEMGLKVKRADRPESLELAKLWETVYRAIMIASWQELHRASAKFEASLPVIAEFIAEVHEVLKDRPVYFPDYIGGHCLIPNTVILNSTFPSKLFEFVLESNEQRRKELQDERVKREVEELKKIFLKLTKPDYYSGGI
jgi:UDP-N-acetyl-D-mannosaminuronate dehydrogenase